MKSVPQTKVFSRVGVKGANREEVMAILSSLNISPLRLVDRLDGDFTLEFGFLEENRLLEMLESVPKSYFALHARVH